MIPDEKITAILADWEKRTPEERLLILDRADQLRAEANNWAAFYRDDFQEYLRYSRDAAIALVTLAKGGFIGYVERGACIEDDVSASFEVAILEELRSPSFIAFDRLSKCLHDALKDSVIQSSPDAVKLINSWDESISLLCIGCRSVDEIDPPFEVIAQRTRSGDAAYKARRKNAGPRAWVLTEWENRPDLGQSKASFARQYVPLVKQRFGVLVTEDTIKRDWLPKSGK